MWYNNNNWYEADCLKEDGFREVPSLPWAPHKPTHGELCPQPVRETPKVQSSDLPGLPNLPGHVNLKNLQELK